MGYQPKECALTDLAVVGSSRVIAYPVPGVRARVAAAYGSSVRRRFPIAVLGEGGWGGGGDDGGGGSRRIGAIWVAAKWFRI